MRLEYACASRQRVLVAALTVVCRLFPPRANRNAITAQAVPVRAMRGASSRSERLQSGCRSATARNIRWHPSQLCTSARRSRFDDGVTFSCGTSHRDDEHGVGDSSGRRHAYAARYFPSRSAFGPDVATAVTAHLCGVPHRAAVDHRWRFTWPPYSDRRRGWCVGRPARVRDRPASVSSSEWDTVCSRWRRRGRATRRRRGTRGGAGGRGTPARSLARHRRRRVPRPKDH